MFNSKWLVPQPGCTSSCTAWLHFLLYSLAALPLDLYSLAALLCVQPGCTSSCTAWLQFLYSLPALPLDLYSLAALPDVQPGCTSSCTAWLHFLYSLAALPDVQPGCTSWCTAWLHFLLTCTAWVHFLVYSLAALWLVQPDSSVVPFSIPEDTQHTSNQHLKVLIQGKQLSHQCTVTDEKLLGVQIDNNLSWKQQIKKLKQTVCYKLSILRRIRKHILPETRNLFYNMFMKPHLEYGCSVWGQPRRPKHFD